MCKLKSVFHQIDQDLLQSNLVSNEFLWHVFAHLQDNSGILLSSLHLKYFLDKIERLLYFERLLTLDKTAQFDHFEIKHVIDET